jgi:hypothetical protein
LKKTLKADTWEELEEAVGEAVRSHFEEGKQQIYKIVFVG